MAALTVSKEDEKRVKGLGFLSNKGTDNFSGRVITVNGKLTADEHIAIGEAARKFGNGNVVYTTRMTVEVQGIPYEKIDEFRAFIEQAGMSTGGTGAKVRPVVSCKGTTCQYGRIDTFDLSEKIHKAFYEGYLYLGLKDFATAFTVSGVNDTKNSNYRFYEFFDKDFKGVGVYGEFAAVGKGTTFTAWKLVPKSNLTQKLNNGQS